MVPSSYSSSDLGMSPEEFANAEDWDRQNWDKEKPKSKKVCCVAN